MNELKHIHHKIYGALNIWINLQEKSFPNLPYYCCFFFQQDRFWRLITISGFVKICDAQKFSGFWKHMHEALIFYLSFDIACSEKKMPLFLMMIRVQVYPYRFPPLNFDILKWHKNVDYIWTENWDFHIFTKWHKLIVKIFFQTI